MIYSIASLGDSHLLFVTSPDAERGESVTILMGKYESRSLAIENGKRAIGGTGGSLFIEEATEAELSTLGGIQQESEMPQGVGTYLTLKRQEADAR